MAHDIAVYARKRAAIRRGRDMALAFLGLPKSMTRNEAIAAGVKTYYTGKRCRAEGHLAPRYTANRHCTECSKHRMAAYHAKRKAVGMALANGAKTYQPEEPCQNGHTGPRYASNGQCIQCGKDNVRRYKERKKNS